MDVSFIPGIKCVLIGDHEVGKTSLISAYGTHEPLNPLLPGITEPIQIHVEHLYKLYLLSIHDTEGVHPPPDSLSTDDSDSPPASLGLPISSSQRSSQVARTGDSVVTARRIEYGLANVVLICFSLADRSSFQHVMDVWHKEIHQLCPHIPCILIGTKLDLRRPDPTTPQPQVRAHPFSRFTFSRPTVARSNSVATTSSHSSEEKTKKKVKSEKYQHFGACQIKPPMDVNREQPSTDKHTSWYGRKRKNSVPLASSPHLRRTPLATGGYPPNSPSLPSAPGSPTGTSPRAAHFAPPKPSTSKRPSLNVSGVGRSLSTINPFKRTRAGSLSTAAYLALGPHLSATHSEGRTELLSPDTQPPNPGPLNPRPALLHRHTTDMVTVSNTGGRSGSGKSVAFSGTPLTLAQLAVGGGVTASGRERFNQPRIKDSYPISPTMSPITSHSSFGEPITGPTPTSGPDPFSTNPASPPSPSKGKAKVASIKSPSASTPTSGSHPPGSPEVAPGANPHHEEDEDGGRNRMPRTSKRNSPISYSEAHALAQEIGASAYVECSALTLVNVVAVFEEAVKVAVERRTASSSTFHKNRRASLSISSQKDCVVG